MKLIEAKEVTAEFMLANIFRYLNRRTVTKYDRKVKVRLYKYLKLFFDPNQRVHVVAKLPFSQLDCYVGMLSLYNQTFAKVIIGLFLICSCFRMSDQRV